MAYRFLIISSVLLFTAIAAVAQGQFIVKEELQPRWQMVEADTYQKFDADKGATTIYFGVKPAVYRTDYLILKANQPFSVLLNNKLLADDVVALNMPIDSLMSIHNESDFFFAVHSKSAIDSVNLSTSIQAAVLIGAGKPDENYRRADNQFRDFSVTAVLILVIFFVIIIHLNPGLSSDFFSIRKVFSFRENEDDHHYYRVTSATILFYVFTSALLSFYLLVIARFITVNTLTASLTDASYWMLLYIWMKLSLYIVFLLFIKITLVYLISTLFRVRTIAGYHFFNFVRMLLITLCILTVVLMVYYIPHGQYAGFYQFLYTVIPWILGAWIVLGFFKLASRIHHSAFHLFSYICITELLPFLLILKVLNT